MPHKHSTKRSQVFYVTVVTAFLVTLFFAFAACAQSSGAKDEPALPSLEQMQEREPTNDDALDALIGTGDYSGQDVATQLRRESMKDAAISYGARGGLANRTRQIMETLDENQFALDKVYDFRQLLVPAPSNLQIEPPIISESLNAFIVSNEGDTAAVSDVIYNISRQAQIVPAPRNWRQYLWRKWDDEIAPPPNLLLPETYEERVLWRKWVEKGWYQGIAQADAIFEADLNLLVADYEGMVRYRVLLAQGKVSSPFAIIEDRGVTGGGNEIRIGDRAIKLSNPAQLKRSANQWIPGTR